MLLRGSTQVPLFSPPPTSADVTQLALFLVDKSSLYFLPCYRPIHECVTQPVSRGDGRGVETFNEVSPRGKEYGPEIGLVFARIGNCTAVVWDIKARGLHDSAQKRERKESDGKLERSSIPQCCLIIPFI